MTTQILGFWAHRPTTQTSTPDLTSPDFTFDVEPARAFYDLNYEAIAGHIQKIGRVVVKGASRDRICRFCGKSEKNRTATFEQKAHGFPELIGNKTFITNFECDVCNGEFGKDIEDHLGRYLKPYRLLASIRGKKGFPVIKDEKNGWRVYRDASGLHIEHDSRRPIAKVDMDKRTMIFSIPCDTFIPIKVYKAFVKMGLCLLPETEVPNFGDAINWIRNKGIFDISPPPLSSTLISGSPIDALSAILLRRLIDTRPLPYMTMCMVIANTQFQFMIPSPSKDAHVNGETMKFPSFPIPLGLRKSRGSFHFEQIDLSSSDPLRDFCVPYEFQFDERLEVS